MCDMGSGEVAAGPNIPDLGLNCFTTSAYRPIIILVLIFVSLNFINIGLEQAFNPRLRAVTGA